MGDHDYHKTENPLNNAGLDKADYPLRYFADKLKSPMFKKTF
jgi:hypothetical protein